MPTQYTTLKLNEADRYAHSWVQYLTAGADISQNGSVWTVTPGVGLTISEEKTEQPLTSALVTATLPGAYRVTNTVNFNDGAVGVEEIIFNVPATAAPDGSYLSSQEAQERLWTRFNLQSSPNQGDIYAASQELDDKKHRFKGQTYDPVMQVLQFPRSITLPGDTPNEVPERILDWVALRSYQLSREDKPPSIEERVDTLRVTYTRGKKDRVERLMRGLLRPHLMGASGASIV